MIALCDQVEKLNGVDLALPWDLGGLVRAGAMEKRTFESIKAIKETTMPKSASRSRAILIASDSGADGILVKSLLHEAFEQVCLSVDPEQIAAAIDFMVKPLGQTLAAKVAQRFQVSGAPQRDRKVVTG